jgi:predicted nucleic acid-binding protein
MAGILLDTNVLIYAHDPSEPTKQGRAIEVLDRLHLTGTGLLSAQCLGEFFSIAVRARRPMLSASDAAAQVERLLQAWPVLDITPLVVGEAIRGVRVHRLPYWDAQLWATARLNQTPVIFSEDFSPGVVLDGIRFVNPFARDFDIETWAPLT